MWPRDHLGGRETIYGPRIVYVVMNVAERPFNNHEVWPRDHLQNLFLEQMWPGDHLGGRETT